MPQSGKDSAKKSQVSLPVLILGIIAVIAVVYLQFFSGPPTQPRGPKPNNQPGPVAPSVPSVQSKEQSIQPTAVPDATVQINQSYVSSNEIGKDPFLLPALMQRSKRENVKVVPPPIIPVPINNIPKVDIPKETVVEEQPVLKGIIKTNTGQVAIINYKGKSYILHSGERLPTSDYRLTEINHNDILLESSSKQVKLQKKGEGKK